MIRHSCHVGGVSFYCPGCKDFVTLTTVIVNDVNGHTIGMEFWCYALRHQPIKIAEFQHVEDPGKD